jgi:D-alanyl-D-alanine carboxypeptidase
MRKLIASLMLSSAMLSAHANLTQDLQSTLAQWRTNTNTLGATLLIESPQYHFQSAGGAVSKDSNEAVTLDTLFAVGSITKTFVSAEILRLEAQGKLNINNSIGQYFPQYPRWQSITIKQLLNMTSGIPSYNANPTWINSQTNPKITWTATELIAMAYQQPDDFKPGSNWNYSNTNYELLGKIIEQVTGQSLAKVLQSQFFTPLELNHTYYSESYYPADVMKHIAHGYYKGTDMSNEITNSGSAAGGMLMSTTDLASWINHLLIKQDVLPAKQLNEMLTTVPITYTNIRPDDSRYGLGIFTAYNAEHQFMIWYTGVVSGYSSAFIWIPSSKTLIIAQANVQRINDQDFNLLFPNADLLQTVMTMLSSKNTLVTSS